MSVLFLLESLTMIMSEPSRLQHDGALVNGMALTSDISSVLFNTNEWSIMLLWPGASPSLLNCLHLLLTLPGVLLEVVAQLWQ